MKGSANLKSGKLHPPVSTWF